MNTSTALSVTTPTSAKDWYDSRVKEIETLRRNDAFEEVRLDDPRVQKYLKEGNRITDTMMTGKAKFNDQHVETQLKNRCVYRGDQELGLDRGGVPARGLLGRAPCCLRRTCVPDVARVEGRHCDPGRADPSTTWR